MLAIKAQFDGKKIILPRRLKIPPSAVIVVFEDFEEEGGESHVWLKAQEATFAKVWENKDDAVYDTL